MIRRQVLTIGAAALAALLTVTACSSGNQAATSSSTSAGTSAASSSAPAAQAHNQSDVTFAQDMIPHHQQAVQMSDIILGKQGIDPRVVQLANQIKAAQGPEIQQMQGWLSQWGQPTMSMAPGMVMPGIGRSGHQRLAKRAGCRCQQAVLDRDDPAPSGRDRDGPRRNQVGSKSASRSAGPLDRHQPAAGDQHHANHLGLAVEAHPRPARTPHPPTSAAFQQIIEPC